MAIIAKDSKKEWTLASEGIHQAVCVDVVDLGDVQTTFGLKHRVRIVWQVDELDEKGRKVTIAKPYTLSLNEKSTLYKDLTCWRAKKFTPKELDGFDLERLVGVNCQLQVIHNLGEDGRKYANIQAIIQAPKGLPKMEPEDFIRDKDKIKEPASIAGELDDQINDSDLPVF